MKSEELPSWKISNIRKNSLPESKLSQFDARVLLSLAYYYHPFTETSFWGRKKSPIFKSEVNFTLNLIQ